MFLVFNFNCNSVCFFYVFSDCIQTLNLLMSRCYVVLVIELHSECCFPSITFRTFMYFAAGVVCIPSEICMYDYM